MRLPPLLTGFALLLLLTLPGIVRADGQLSLGGGYLRLPAQNQGVGEFRLGFAVQPVWAGFEADVRYRPSFFTPDKEHEVLGHGYFRVSSPGMVRFFARIGAGGGAVLDGPSQTPFFSARGGAGVEFWPGRVGFAISADGGLLLGDRDPLRWDVGGIAELKIRLF